MLVLATVGSALATTNTWRFRVFLDEREIGWHEFRLEQEGDARRRLTSHAGAAALPSCIMTFAYWDPGFLEQSRLLNPQSGKYGAVKSRTAGTETMVVRGSPRTTIRRQLFAEGRTIDLWYSTEGEWLGLESHPDGKRRLQYRLQ